MQEYEPLAQFIESVVDELQDTNIDTKITVSTHDRNTDDRIQMPNSEKYEIIWNIYVLCLGGWSPSPRVDLCLHGGWPLCALM